MLKNPQVLHKELMNRINLSLNYNPNHDDRGRFGKGSGGGNKPYVRKSPSGGEPFEWKP